MEINPTEYERATAIVVHATIKRSIENAYPNLSTDDCDAMFIGILDRLARLRGWAIRREYVDAEDE